VGGIFTFYLLPLHSSLFTKDFMNGIFGK